MLQIASLLEKKFIENLILAKSHFFFFSFLNGLTLRE